MISTPTVTLPVIELLADKAKAPQALLLRPDALAPETFRHIIDSDVFQSLVKRMPCIISEATTCSPELLEELTKLGCTTQPASSIHTLAQDSAAPAPVSARWIAGDWWCAAPAKPTASQSASRALALQLVQLVTADADTHEIEAVLRRDPTISYQLLRVVNSLGMGVSRQITSFSQAILIMGRAQLRRWLNLMLFSSRQGDERSAMLLARVAVRARCMELLAKASGMDKGSQEAAFMTGMFSLLGILFGMSLAEVLKPLKISDAIRSAVLEKSGELGALLATVEEAENGIARLEQLEQWQMTPADFHLIQLEAVLWTLDVIKESGGGKHA
jgi:hypothetical protein